MADLEPLDPEVKTQALNAAGTGGNSEVLKPSAVSRTSSMRSQSADAVGPKHKELTHDMVLRACTKAAAKGQHAPCEDSDSKLLARQTHMHLHGQQITHLSPVFRQLPGLEVLYLYDNCLSNVEHLQPLKNLKHLYLQNNQLKDLSGLRGLASLQKLYIQGNQLEVISGLESCTQLQELHIANQKLPEGASLEFDPSSMHAIARALHTLCASRCHLTDAALEQLSPLVRVRKVDLSENHISSPELLSQLLGSLPILQNLDLQGNPITKVLKYRDSVILMSDTLKELDGQPITGQQREFLLRLHIQKMKAQLKAELADADMAHNPGSYSHPSMQQGSSTATTAAGSQSSSAPYSSSSSPPYTSASSSASKQHHSSNGYHRQSSTPPPYSSGFSNSSRSIKAQGPMVGPKGGTVNTKVHQHAAKRSSHGGGPGLNRQDGGSGGLDLALDGMQIRQ